MMGEHLLSAAINDLLHEGETLNKRMYSLLAAELVASTARDELEMHVRAVPHPRNKRNRLAIYKLVRYYPERNGK